MKSNSSREIFQHLHHPSVVCTIISRKDLSQLSQVMADTHRPDLLELRLDLLRDLIGEALDGIAQLATAPPVLITARRGDEGGAGDLTSEARKNLILNHLDHASFIDIEIRSLEAERWDTVIAKARSQTPRIQIVGSFHDFQSTPSSQELTGIINRGVQTGVDLVKIATRLHSPEDMSRLEALLDSPPVPLAVMGMGELGKDSRVQLALKGSFFNYGFAAEQSAPGQWQANELVARLR